MSVIELLLVGVIGLNIILLFILISLMRDLIFMKMMIQQVHIAFGTVMNKLGAQDVLLAKMANAFNDLTDTLGTVVDRLTMLEHFPPNQTGSLYRTVDGKYMGSTLEDLLKKIQSSGEEQNYLSHDELDGLKRLFEDDDDDDDDDDETFL